MTAADLRRVACRWRLGTYVDLVQVEYLWDFVSIASSLEDMEWYAREHGGTPPEVTEADGERIRRAAASLANASNLSELRRA